MGYILVKKIKLKRNHIHVTYNSMGYTIVVALGLRHAIVQKKFEDSESLSSRLSPSGSGAHHHKCKKC
jgi:hypothetical protein